MSEKLPPIFLDQTVAKVQNLLRPDELAILKRIRLPGSVSAITLLSTFLYHLFTRVPDEIVICQTPEDVAEIVRDCFAALTGLASAPDRIFIEPLRKGTPGFCTTMDDCPFIVSSIAERISDAGLRANIFIHPVLVFDNQVTALSYVQLESSPPAALLPAVKQSLVLLKQVVSDFEAMTAPVLALAEELKPGLLHGEHADVDAHELATFLRWLMDGCFFLLGVARWEHADNHHPISKLGIWKLEVDWTQQAWRELEEDLQLLRSEAWDLSIRKSRCVSMVHRPATLMNIVIRSNASNTILSVTGYLTSKAWAGESQDIPLLRLRVGQILREEGTIPNSHDYKYMVEVVDNMPTDEALCLPKEGLRAVIQIALGVFNREVTRSLILVDRLSRRALTMIILPPSRFSASVRSSLQSKIEAFFKSVPHSSDVHLDASKRSQYRVYFSTPLPSDIATYGDLKLLAHQLSEETTSWDDRVQSALLSTPHRATIRPSSFFPLEYKSVVGVEEAVADIDALQRLSAAVPITVRIHQSSTSGEPILSILSINVEVSMSRAVPVLENVGLNVRGAHSYTCKLGDSTFYIMKLQCSPTDQQPVNIDHFNQHVALGLEAVLRGTAQNDSLNMLLRSIGLTIREISLLRTYCSLLWQANKMSTRRTMWESLVGAPKATLSLRNIFHIKFDPTLNISTTVREERWKKEEETLVDLLRKVPDITHDRILKAIWSLIRATVRTNFYWESENIAVKIRSAGVEIMPYPRPLFEIFVFGPQIEGTHLRSAMVARGGIRWSDRLDDYRAEVLGLMKTQKVKNAIIVPSGAKGGFVLKNPPREPDLLPSAVEKAYASYIRALLSITDNKIDNKVIHPENCVIYDGEDPYFVVAADKGTATFSDLANSIAQREFAFWLDDAFASGGSAGYDHKKYGITAKGGWECVKRHFRDGGISYEDPFTVVGIGDMSGDVFGNGLLLSKSMRLFGAFNHSHVFVDPNPDPQTSFDERLRLFNKPRSKWSDYDSKLISQGGGVFGRFDKEIRITTEMRVALDVPDSIGETVDGETLISLILKAPVDLLWNGGIGTYVKASSESHSEVNDGTNDGVRVNATEVRARVVGEGGNLGFTQRARIEYALAGGRINTDAIDNSGGVDLSDHEVNLKLLLGPLVRSNKLSKDDRNTLLREISQDVVEAVLNHNRDQALMLTISHMRSKSSLEEYRALMRDMHKLGYLDRIRDRLPDDAELDDRALEHKGLTRPELAVCSAASKMWIKEIVRNSSLCTEPQLEVFLTDYFPRAINDRFSDQVVHHPLRADIIATEAVNSLAPAVGIPFVHALFSMHTTTVPIVMGSLLAADFVIGSRDLRGRIRPLDSVGSSANFLELWSHLGQALRRATGWLLNYHGSSLSLAQMIELYAPSFQTLVSHVDEVFTGQELDRFQRRVAQYQALGVEPKDAHIFAVFRRILPILEVLWSAREFKCEVRTVARVFSETLDELGVNALFKYEHIVDASNKWEQDLIIASFHEIRRSISLITGQLLARGIHGGPQLREALRQGNTFEAIRSTMADVEEISKQKRPFQAAVLPVMARHLRLFKITKSA